MLVHKDVILHHKPQESDFDTYADMLNNLCQYLEREPIQILPWLNEQTLFRKEWEAANPQNDEERLKVYAEGEGMLFDLCTMATYAREWHRPEMVVEYVKKYLKPGALVLDYAGGIGREARSLLNHGFNVHSVDVGHMLGFNEFLCKKLNASAVADSRIRFIEADHSKGESWWDGIDIWRSIGGRIEPPETFYDAVVNFEFLEHVSDPIDYVKRWHSILHDGGLLICNCRSFNPHTGHVDSTFDYQFKFEPFINEVGFECVDFPRNAGPGTNIYNVEIWQKKDNPKTYNGEDW